MSELKRKLLDVEKVMKCPEDGAELQVVNYEGDIMVQQCKICDGTWLGKDELEAIQKAREIDYSDELEVMNDLGYNAYLLEAQKTGREITCPSCGTEMDSREYARCSQVMIDSCPACHGIWLDSGELSALEVFYESAKDFSKKFPQDYFQSVVDRFRPSKKH